VRTSAVEGKWVIVESELGRVQQLSDHIDESSARLTEVEN
jgi:hypothetical protein